MRNERGMTFVELMVASVVSAAVAGGTLAALVTATRVSMVRSSPQVGEGTGFGQQAIERPRNHVAADDPWFAGMADNTWKNEALPGPTSSESILQPPGAVRRMCVNPVDAEPDGVVDYYRVSVRVCWAGTACPAVGTACP